MRYFKTTQYVPGKGEAWMFTEADEKNTVLRTLTYVPATGELEKIPDPVVKILFMPERLQASSQDEFLKYWNL